ncbi:MAG: hypothetical protein KC503_16650 [Myxococcales bacterium]|nr:hypothetical protein [Myxococcales bacterium]
MRVITAAANLLLSLALCTASAGVALAFKPAPPRDVIRYSDSKTKAQLVIRNKDWRPTSVEVVIGKKRYRWPKPPSLPVTARISSRAKRVVLLGGYGDGCSDLGNIEIYNLRGKKIAVHDLRKKIAGLQKTSQAYTRICCPCRWLHKIELSANGKRMRINVCNKHLVRIDLLSGRLKVIK